MSYENTIYNEDCLLWMKRQEEKIVDLIVTSPPYDKLRNYNGYSFQFEEIAKELYRITKDGGIVVWVVNDGTENGSETGTSFRQALYFKEIGFNIHDTMIYEKSGSPFAAGDKSIRYTQIYEFMFIFSKGKPKTVNLIRDKPNRWAGYRHWGKKSTRQVDGKLIGGKDNKLTQEFGIRNNIWKITCSGGFGQTDKLAYEHPATFPEKLAEDHIISWSNEGDMVFDPMAGSGTTLLMAYKNNRKYIGCEISKEYFQLIEKRFDNIKNRQFNKNEVELEDNEFFGYT